MSKGSKHRLGSKKTFDDNMDAIDFSKKKKVETEVEKNVKNRDGERVTRYYYGPKEFKSDKATEGASYIPSLRKAHAEKSLER